MYGHSEALDPTGSAHKGSTGCSDFPRSTHVCHSNQAVKLEDNGFKLVGLCQLTSVLRRVAHANKVKKLYRALLNYVKRVQF